MQFSTAIIATVLATAATASPLALAVQELESRQIDPNTIDIFSDGSCGNYVTTDGTKATGVCLQLNQPAGSVRVTNVQAGCSFTVDTDSVCSDNAIIAGNGACISGLSSGATINSFSINC